MATGKVTSNWIAELFQSSARPNNQRAIGIEIERLGVWKDGTAFQYHSSKDRQGAKDLLTTLSAEKKWALTNNADGCPLGMSTPLGKVSLEPGSQLELSLDPVDDICTLSRRVAEFEQAVCFASLGWGLHWLGLGVTPISTTSEIELIPSTRYKIMTDYLGKRGELGTSMMRRTSSIQLNFDYSSEKEAIEMVRAALLLTPVSYALFANSPFSEGKLSGYQSYRGHIWSKTDPDRTGLLDVAFDKDFSFKKYAEYLWKRPLMFAQDAQGNYIPANGRSLSELDVHSEENAWNAIRELFTETRIKPGYVEVRSIDGQTIALRHAATAFWTGLIYNADARRIVLEKYGKLSGPQRQALVDASIKDGLKTPDIREFAQVLAQLSKKHLEERKKGEEKYLKPVEEILVSGLNPAARLIQAFEKEWKGDISAVVKATEMERLC